MRYCAKGKSFWPERFRFAGLQQILPANGNSGVETMRLDLDLIWKSTFSIIISCHYLMLFCVCGYNKVSLRGKLYEVTWGYIYWSAFVFVTKILFRYTFEVSNTLQLVESKYLVWNGVFFRAVFSETMQFLIILSFQVSRLYGICPLATV